jgi:putative FmdB family regulatory protein
MPIYVYECAGCGSFEIQLPMSSVSQALSCPDCGRGARRLITPPNLARTPRALADQRLREEASQDAPEVVDAVPPTARRPSRSMTNPKWASLPRP